MSPKSKRFLFFVAAGALSAFLLYYCARQVDPVRFWAGLKALNPVYLLIAFLSTFLIICVKALQFKLYLPSGEKRPWFTLFQAVAVFLMTASLLPFWGGHALFVYLLGSREKVGKTVALSVLTVEQILEGFGKIALFAALAFFVSLPSWMEKGTRGALLAVLLGYGTLIFLAHRYRNYRGGDSPEEGVFRRGLSLFFRWARHLEALKDYKSVLGGVFLSIIMKGLEAAAVFWVQKAFGVELPFYAPLFVVASLSLASMVPMAPGRLGVFEAAVFVVYQHLGLDPTRALSLALFVHVAHSLPLILTGYGVSLGLGLKMKNVPAVSPALRAVSLE